MVKIASFNVENLFARPKAFRGTDLTDNADILEAYHEVNTLIKKPEYSDGDKDQIRDLLTQLDIYVVNEHGAIRRKVLPPGNPVPTWAWLRGNRGSFDREPQDPTESMEIVAKGRHDWIGWIELSRESVNETGTRMTAQVIKDIDADILAVIEAEDRPSLLHFNEALLDGKYRHIMLIDGNDDRGIDVAIMTREGFPIESIRSHVDARDDVGEIFSRDCAQYEVKTPGGTSLHILVNHFKSQSGGKGADKRRRQADKVREIADGLIQQEKHVVVVGDLNEGPTFSGGQAQNLISLYDNNSPLVECYTLPGFDVGPKPGTYDSCGLGNRLDYIFLSKSLQPSYRGGGLFRKGLWGGRKKRPDAWETYPEMTRSVEQASDHAAVYVNLDL